VSSDVPARGPLAPEGLAIDWSGIGALLGRHNLWSQVCPLTGVTAVDAGVLRGGANGERHRLWRPGDAARAPRRDADPQTLAQVVDASVAALARDRRAILVEISGGLDSAIVATSLARSGAAVAGAVNYYWPEPAGDERSWARAIAERCGFALTTAPRDTARIDGDRLMRHAHGPRPGFNAQDPGLDEDLAQRALVLGADALFSGQGGDGVFYQMAHPALAADILTGAPTPGGPAKAMAILARRSRTTVWALWARALRPFDPAAEGAGPPPYLTSRLARPEHAWIADRRGLSPAKQVQIRGLTNAQNAFGDSLRGRAASLVYPLMSQPVMELCLSIPAPLLAIGEVDRPFARAAFQDRLPPRSLARRSKGAVTQYFAKSVAASLPDLRPFLLEGRLVGQGLIDAHGLEALLDAEAMIWRDVVGEILLAAYLEAWVRVWDAKLAGRAGPDPRLS
jgi:asparagine synthase (glutamine-hydrolysing)